MAKVSIYLNFMGNTEDAFNFYKSVFNTEFSAAILYLKDTPPQEGMSVFSEQGGNKVMHVCLPILDGINIMGTDMLESFGLKLIIGNNSTINL